MTKKQSNVKVEIKIQSIISLDNINSTFKTCDEQKIKSESSIQLSKKFPLNIRCLYKISLLNSSSINCFKLNVKLS